MQTVRAWQPARLASSFWKLTRSAPAGGIRAGPRSRRCYRERTHSLSLGGARFPPRSSPNSLKDQASTGQTGSGGFPARHSKSFSAFSDRTRGSEALPPSSAWDKRRDRAQEPSPPQPTLRPLLPLSPSQNRGRLRHKPSGDAVRGPAGRRRGSRARDPGGGGVTTDSFKVLGRVPCLDARPGLPALADLLGLGDQLRRRGEFGGAHPRSPSTL